MTRTCDYCNESVSEDAYLEHLRTNHYEELGAIDRRQVDEELGPLQRQGTNLTRYALGVGVLVLFALAYATVFIGAMADSGLVVSESSSAAIQPDPTELVHFHGTIELTIDGESVDFSESQYLMQADCFHFHNDDGVEDGLWHVHCGDVSLEYAMETLGIGLTADTVEIDGETYSDDDPETSVSITVDGEPVDPEEYVLDGVGPIDRALEGEGDDVRIVVEDDE